MDIFQRDLAGIRVRGDLIIRIRVVAIEDVPRNSILAGNPAKVIKKIEV